MSNRFRSISYAWLMSLALACTGELNQTREVERDTLGIQLAEGFAHEIVASGFRNPTAMTLAPDGRVFITEQTGNVRIVKNGQLLATPFASLTVDAGNERGLVGIALDPAFSQNGFVYLFYTTPQNGVHNRVSRLTSAGDVAVGGSERILVEFPRLSDASNHNAGALNFGADGKLYVAHGDNAETELAQNMAHPFGKILRFNSDGTIPLDNPFYAVPIDLSDAIWAFGLRNPFTVAVSPASGRIFANDVGGGDPEEINQIVRGGNYGHGGGPAPIAAVHSYPRIGRCAITGGTFYEPSVLNFPTRYQGRYFFADYCAGEIWSMNQDGTDVVSFARSSEGHLNNPVDLDVGLDGSLYYLQRGNGEKLGRIYVPRPDCSSDEQCDDDNVCNGEERCQAGRCQAGPSLRCDDGDACTDNLCEPEDGCYFQDSGRCNCDTDAQCDDGDDCTDDRCEGRVCTSLENGFCAEAPLALSYERDDGGWNDVRGLTDGNLDAKVSTGVSPNCVVYGLTGPSTVTSARLLEDNAGAWRVDGWKVQVDTGSGLRDVIGYSDSPNAMPVWNELRLPSTPGVTRVAVCLQTTGPIEAAEIEVRGRLDGASESRCGDATCDASETCQSCAADCGACQTGPLPLSLVSDGGGWSAAAALTDGDLLAKVSTGVSPNCLVYGLPAPSTVRGARLLEDNDGAWHVDAWKLDVDQGAGFREVVGYQNTPVAMPGWNELSFLPQASVTRVRVCLQNDGVIEAAELQMLGEPSVPGGACGDRVCGSSESCSDCPWDCGTCSSAGLGLDGRPDNTRCVAGASNQSPPLLLSQHPCVETAANPPLFRAGVVPYELNLPFWSDGAVKTRFLALPNGTSLRAASDGDITIPAGAVTIKHFTFQGAPIETRFFVRHDDGRYGAYTYAWNQTGSEAELVPDTGSDATLTGGQPWRFPSEAQCFECHNDAAGASLGLEVQQLARLVRYPSTGRSAQQVQTLVGLGMLEGQTTSAPFAGPGDTAASLEARARAYLHVNCATCHRPGGPGYGLADYRYGTPSAASRTCNEPSILSAYAGLDLIEPGDPSRSVAFLRMNLRGTNQMPPIGSNVVDAEGALLLSAYITSLTSCEAP